MMETGQKQNRSGTEKGRKQNKTGQKQNEIGWYGLETEGKRVVKWTETG